MKVVKDGKVVEVTEKAYRVIYKGVGYKPYVEDSGDIGESKVEAVDENNVTYTDMTKAEIIELLDAKGIEYSSRDNKDKLIELLEAGE